MTARLYTTVYTANDLPTEEAHLVSKSLGTVDVWTELEYTVVEHGTGLLKGKINRHLAAAALLVQDRYLVVWSDAGPVGGAFLEAAPIDLSAEEGPGDEWAVWGGRGQVAIFERGRMDATSNLSGGVSPIEGYWDLDSQGDFAGASNAHPIPMFKRALVEMLLNSPSGIDVVDHSGFDYDEDSAGVPVPFLDGEAQGADVGDDGLSLLQRFDQLGGVVFSLSHLFKLDAYLTHGTDRSGAFGAATVRFEKGVNIAAAISRKVRGSVYISHLIVGGADYVYRTVVDPEWVAGDVVRWGFLALPEASDDDQLDAAGLAHIARRKRQTDAWELPLHDHGDDPANGVYEPAPLIADGHFWLGDTVSFDTGSGTYDADEETSPVASITWRLMTGDEANGDYQVIVGIGSTFAWSAAQASEGTAPGSQHRLRLCPFDAGIILSGVGWKSLQLGAEPDGWKLAGFDDSAWTDTEVTGGGPATLTMMNPEGAYVAGASLLYRREFYIEPEDLTGAAVAFLYALDNAGTIYVNGVAVATLAGSASSNYDTDHATTLARSAFRAGFNCIAISTTDDGLVDSKAGISIAIDTTNGMGTSTDAQRCDRHYHASEIDENTDGNVQAAFDAIRAAIAGDADARKLRQFRTALAKRDSTPVDIVAIGDSITEGALASSNATRWTSRLLDLLRGHMQPVGVAGGIGYRAAIQIGRASDFTEGGTVVDNFTYGLGRRAAELQSGDSLTLTFTGTGFDILWAQVVGGGTFSYAVDGGAATNVSTAGAAEGGHVTSIDSLTAESHTLVIAGVSGTSIVEGVMVYNGDEAKGIRMWEAGHSTYQVTHFTSSTTWRDSLETVQPDLVIIALGVTDWIDSDVAAATYQSNLETLIANIRSSVTTDPSFVLLAYYEPTNATPTGTWDDYLDAMAAIAAADDEVVFVNIDARMGSVSPSAASGLINVDLIHPTTAGHQFIADALAETLAFPGLEPIDVSVDVPEALDDLTDVAITAAAEGDQIRHRSGVWVNEAFALDSDAVRDAGHWEVVVSGSAPPVAVTNEAEDDWVYGWISG